MAFAASSVIEHLWNNRQDWPQEGLFNVNVPVVDEHRPVHLTRFHKTSYGSIFMPLQEGKPPSGTDEDSVEYNVRSEVEGHESGRTIFHFAPDIRSMSHPKDAEPGTDAWALINKYVSGKLTVTNPKIKCISLINFFSDSNSHGRCIRGRQAIEHFWI